MNYKTIIINGVEYEMRPYEPDFGCNACYFYEKIECNNAPCIKEDCYFIPKEL